VAHMVVYMVAAVVPVENAAVVVLHTGRLALQFPPVFHNCYKSAVRQKQCYRSLGRYGAIVP